MLEERLREALVDGVAAVEESDDLFERVQLSIADDRMIATQRRRRVMVSACFVGAVAVFVAATVDQREGEWVMDWWVLELLTDALLIGLLLWLGPFIKRFGRSYAADVFRNNPRTGKSFIVLMDVAYYLIFSAYILFTMSFEAAGSWDQTVNASQLKSEVARVGGILLIVGILHGLNVLTLPVMGRLLTLNRHLDEQAGPPPT